MDWFDSSPSSFSFHLSHSSSAEERSERVTVSSMAFEMACKLLCAVITCAFAVAGFLVGSMTGAVLGLATESGFFRGAGVGAISGAVFTIESVDSCLALWSSNGSRISTFLYVVDIIASILNGRLVREKVGPAVQSAVQSQMSSVLESPPLWEVFDLFETGGAGGLSKNMVDKLPEITVADKESDTSDDCLDLLSCPICLQDFHGGDAARILPNCMHIYHLTCIDSWLMRHANCPLCRRDV